MKNEVSMSELPIGIGTGTAPIPEEPYGTDSNDRKFGKSQRCAYNTSAAPNSMLAITRVTTPTVNHRERTAMRENAGLPSADSGTAATGEISADCGAGGVTGRSRYSILATKL